MGKKMTYQQAVQKTSTKLETPEWTRSTIILSMPLLALAMLGLIYVPTFSMLVLLCATPPSIAYTVWSITALLYLRNKSLKGKPQEEMMRIMRKATVILWVHRGLFLALFSMACLVIGLRMLRHFIGVPDVICGLIVAIYLLMFIVLGFMWRRMLIAIVEGNAWWVRILFGGSAAAAIVVGAAGAGLGTLLARVAPREILSLIVTTYPFPILREMC